MFATKFSWTGKYGKYHIYTDNDESLATLLIKDYLRRSLNKTIDEVHGHIVSVKISRKMYENKNITDIYIMKEILQSHPVKNLRAIIRDMKVQVSGFSTMKKADLVNKIMELKKKGFPVPNVKMYEKPGRKAPPPKAKAKPAPAPKAKSPPKEEKTFKPKSLEQYVIGSYTANSNKTLEDAQDVSNNLDIPYGDYFLQLLLDPAERPNKKLKSYKPIFSKKAYIRANEDETTSNNLYDIAYDLKFTYKSFSDFLKGFKKNYAKFEEELELEDIIDENQKGYYKYWLDYMNDKFKKFTTK